MREQYFLKRGDGRDQIASYKKTSFLLMGAFRKAKANRESHIQFKFSIDSSFQIFVHICNMQINTH